MAQNRVSAVLAQTDKDAIMASIKAIAEKMPFAIDLSPEDIKTMPKLGDKSLAFVTRALEVAVQNPGFLPRDFDVEEFRKDVTRSRSRQTDAVWRICRNRRRKQDEAL